jgi:hypothetical protein
MKKTTTAATGVPVELLNRFGDKISGRLMLTALRAARRVDVDQLTFQKMNDSQG